MFSRTKADNESANKDTHCQLRGESVFETQRGLRQQLWYMDPLRMWGNFGVCILVSYKAIGNRKRDSSCHTNAKGNCYPGLHLICEQAKQRAPALVAVLKFTLQ